MTRRPASAIARVVPGGEERRKFSGKDLRRPDFVRLRRDLETYMARQGLRSTEQRRLIVDAFFESHEHVTLDQLLERVRAADSRVGYATVYRTMKMLADGGIAHERKFGDGFTRYELADEGAHHDHLICIHCGTIQEFEEPLIEDLQGRVATRYGFEVHHHKHELYGRCRACAEKQSREPG
ncbi:MAG TPA: Fur family transcriptional regulator [Polyangiaceae bacterium]